MPYPPLTLRADSGAVLTVQQHDDNHRRHEQRIDDQIANPPDANGIADITKISATQLRITLDDLTQFTFSMPIAEPVWRGAWAPATFYAAFDLVTVEGIGILRVTRDHTSGASFDPDAADSDGPLYILVFAVPAGPPPAPSKTVSAAAYTLALADSSKYLRFTNPAGCIVTLPFNADTAIPLDAEFHLRHAAAGGSDPAYVEVVGAETSDASVVVNGIEGFLNRTPRQGAVLTVKKISTDVWDLWGLLDIEPVSS